MSATEGLTGEEFEELQARLLQLHEGNDASTLPERGQLSRRIFGLVEYFRLLRLIEDRTFQTADDALARTIEALQTIVCLAACLDDAPFRQSYFLARLHYMQAIHAGLCTEVVKQAARILAEASVAMGMPPVAIEQILLGANAFTRQRESEAFVVAMEAEQPEIDAGRARYDEMGSDEKQALTRRIRNMEDRLRSRVREDRRFTRQLVYAKPQLYRGRGRSRAARTRRAPSRTASRRAQTDSGGDGPPGGPEEPPNPEPKSRWRAAACGLATVRPGRPRGQTSTARSGE